MDQDTEVAQPDHLLKEYELCWQGVNDNNTRLWTSASIFLSGAILALTWLGTRPLGVCNWAEFSLVAIIVPVVWIVMYSYLRIFEAWELFDRIEFYRAEQIEQHLKLWRVRYRLYIRASQVPTEEDSGRLDAMEKEIAERLKIPIEELRNRRANKYFRLIIRIIPVAAAFLLARGLVITLGWLN